MNYQEKRRAPRYEVRADAVVTLGTQTQTQTPCAILDINEYGARLEFETGDPPDNFYLVEVVDPVAYKARVVWRRAPQVGLRFTETWDLEGPGAPAWMLEIRRDALRERGRARGIELAWSADDD